MIDPNYSCWAICPSSSNETWNGSFIFLTKDKVYCQNQTNYHYTSQIIEHYSPLTYIETVKKLEKLFDFINN